MAAADLNGLHAGYVAQMLEAYLDAPASVPVEWRDLFEREPEAFARSLPGLAGLVGAAESANGAATILANGVPAPAATAALPPPTPATTAPAPVLAAESNGAPVVSAPEPTPTEAAPAVDE